MKAVEKYKLMSRAERRVAIAKDVIKAIRAKKFRSIDTGRYVTTSKSCDIIDQKAAKWIMSSCTVCARGAMLICRIAKYNGVVVDLDNWLGRVEQDDTTKALRDAFSASQLDMIEAAFECRDYRGCDESDPTPAGIVSAIAFGDAIPFADDRLLAIMQNIVDHAGAFKPAVQYVVQ